MIVLIILGILVYVFLARVFVNLLFIKSNTIWDYEDRFGLKFVCDDRAAFGAFFPIILLVIICYFICKLPMKLADFCCNPANYKFKIKIERKKELQQRLRSEHAIKLEEENNPCKDGCNCGITYGPIDSNQEFKFCLNEKRK